MLTNTLLKDIPKENYVFTDEDFDTFKEIYWRDKSWEINKARKAVQSKLLSYNDEIMNYFKNNKYDLHNHYSERNITSLPYCTDFGNGDRVAWLGIRYGVNPDIINLMNYDKDREDKKDGFLMFSCLGVNVISSGVEIGLTHSIPRNSYDRGYLHDNIDNPEVQSKLLDAMYKLKGYGFKWYTDNGEFEIDKHSVGEFIDWYKKNDTLYTYSFCTVVIPRWDERLTKSNWVKTCLDYLTLIYDLYLATRWQPKR